MSGAIATNSNPFLSAAMLAARRERQLYPLEDPFEVRIEQLPWGNFVQLWFITRGCRWDGCTMCNYGAAPAVDVDTMVDAVAKGLRSIAQRDVNLLLVSPSGSMLDPGEVPPEARRRIFELMRAHPAPVLEFETRAETVSDVVAAEVAEALRGKMVAVTLGLESSSAWVQRYCVNKGSSPEDFIRAAKILRAHGLEVIANVSLGTAFLTPAEAIDDAVATVRWALENGAGQAVLYPLQVKRHTLLETLVDLGAYRSPSLWSLVEVLDRLGPQLRERTTISWYRNYYSDTLRDKATTCARCEGRVLQLLDGYRAAQTTESLAPLINYRCACKRRWQESLTREGAPLPERLIGSYDRLAEVLNLEGMWQPRRDTVARVMALELDQAVRPPHVAAAS